MHLLPHFCSFIYLNSSSSFIFVLTLFLYVITPSFLHLYVLAPSFFLLNLCTFFFSFLHIYTASFLLFWTNSKILAFSSNLADDLSDLDPSNLSLNGTNKLNPIPSAFQSSRHLPVDEDDYLQPKSTNPAAYMDLIGEKGRSLSFAPR